MNQTLPAGYQASTLRPEYEQGVVDMMNAYWQWLNGGNFTTLADMQSEWNGEEFNRQSDSQVILSPDGRVVGYSDFFSFSSLHVRSFGWFSIDPQHMGMGIEDYLIEWNIERAQQEVPKAPEGVRVVLHMGTTTGCQPICELYERHGFEAVRYSYRMRIDFDRPPSAPVIPEGFTIRPMIAGEEERETLFAAYDSFRDHWGAIDEPFEEYFQHWMSRLKNEPNYDPSLFFVAVDGSEVAGVALCYPKIEEVPSMGWVGTLGVRRAWRKRGLGMALLRYAFQEFYRRGSTSAGLGVDTQNLTGATRLYEKAGMHIWRKQSTYEYELRAGENLMKQEIAAD